MQPKQSQPIVVKTTPPDPSGATTSGTTPPTSTSTARNLRPHTKVDYKDLNTGASQFGREQFRKMGMGKRSSQKIGGQSQKNVFGRTFPSNFKKFILIFYSLLKMTQGITHPESDADFIAAAHVDNFLENHKGIQCLNIPHIQLLALKIATTTSIKRICGCHFGGTPILR
jgi:hypothetical protein